MSNIEIYYSQSLQHFIGLCTSLLIGVLVGCSHQNDIAGLSSTSLTEIPHVDMQESFSPSESAPVEIRVTPLAIPTVHFVTEGHDIYRTASLRSSSPPNLVQGLSFPSGAGGAGEEGGCSGLDFEGPITFLPDGEDWHIGKLDAGPHYIDPLRLHQWEQVTNLFRFSGISTFAQPNEANAISPDGFQQPALVTDCYLTILPLEAYAYPGTWRLVASYDSRRFELDIVVPELDRPFVLSDDGYRRYLLLGFAPSERIVALYFPAVYRFGVRQYDLQVSAGGFALVSGLEAIHPTSGDAMFFVGEEGNVIGTDAPESSDSFREFASLLHDAYWKSRPIADDPVVIAYGSTVTLTHPGVGSDEIYFDGNEGDIVTIEVRSNSFQPYFDVYTQQDRGLLGETADMDYNALAARITNIYLPITGRYLVEVLASGWVDPDGVYSPPEYTISLSVTPRGSYQTPTPYPAYIPAFAPASPEEAEDYPSIWEGIDYIDPTSPTVIDYDIILYEETPHRWGFRWCGSNTANLHQILEPLSVEMYYGMARLNGSQWIDPLDDSQILVYDTETCRVWVTVIESWFEVGGFQILEIRYHLDRSINDGTNTYAAGDYVQRIWVAPKD